MGTRTLIKKLLKQVGFDISDEDILEFADSIYSWQPFPETHDVLAQLKQMGYKLIILSNIDSEIIKKSVELMGIGFDGVVTAEEVGSYKPAHGHWEEMLKRFNAKKEEVLHVAASYIHDIIPAREQGFNAIWINRNSEKSTMRFSFTPLRCVRKCLVLQLSTFSGKIDSYDSGNIVAPWGNF